jgi:hypothetical protein
MNRHGDEPQGSPLRLSDYSAAASSGGASM